MNDDNKALPVIDILEIWQDVWKNKFLVIALMALALVLNVVRVKYLVPDTYTASGVLYVRSDLKTGIPGVGTDANDIYNARYISTTYVETLKLRSFLSEISDSVDNRYEWYQIKSMMSVEPINETEYIAISVTAGSPRDAYDIANSVCNNANQKFAETFKNGEVTIVDKVIKPQVPNSKGGLLGMIVAIVAGAAIGVLIVLIKKNFDKKLHKSEQITKDHGISVLGETGHASNFGKKKRRKGTKNHREIENIINEDTDFDTIETYKSIRTNIMFSMPKQEKGRVVLVTSSSPGEGKTTTTINLAITFAQMGAKVIVVDCDLRKSRIHRYLQIPKNKGVSNVLCGYEELEKVISKNFMENLDVLTAGDIPPNPAELMETEQFGDMIEKLKETYDYIFIDSPPVTIVTDATIIMKHCTGVLLVARQEFTSRELLNMAIDDIRLSGAKILGSVVHDCTEKKKRYGHYHGGRRTYYSYEYKYSDDEKNR